MTKGANYYEVLKVDRTATSDEIKTAWRKLARLYHPDLLGDVAPQVQHRSEERFKQINEAYNVLSSPERRRVYDERWAPQEPAPPTQTKDASHSTGRHRSHVRRKPRVRATPREIALAVLVATFLLISWSALYLGMKAVSPREHKRGANAVAPPKAAVKAVDPNRVPEGCLDPYGCTAYNILAYDDTPETSGGRRGIFRLRSTGEEITAYCSDDTTRGTNTTPCSKLRQFVGRRLWMYNREPTLCHYFDAQVWVDPQGTYHQGHRQCLHVIDSTPIPLKGTRYQVLAYDPTYRSNDGHAGLFELRSQNEYLLGYCESGTIWDTGANQCATLTAAASKKAWLALDPTADHSLCYDLDSRWLADREGQFHQDNRQCIKILKPEDFPASP